MLPDGPGATGRGSPCADLWDGGPALARIDPPAIGALFTEVFSLATVGRVWMYRMYYRAESTTARRRARPWWLRTPPRTTVDIGPVNKVYDGIDDCVRARSCHEPVRKRRVALGTSGQPRAGAC